MGWLKRLARAARVSRWRRPAIVLIVLMIAMVAWIAPPPQAPVLTFPEGKKFAFTIVDDTDLSTLDRLRPVYDVLTRYGLRTTKTVWVLPNDGSRHDPDEGLSISDPAYREFILDLQKKGFEIALHGVRGGTSKREDTLSGLELFRTTMGAYPRMQVNHSLNLDNLYWGRHLYSLGIFRFFAGLVISQEFSGQDPQSPYFWGDVARERIDYVRRFTFQEINLMSVNPEMPYHMDDKPYVNYWFPTADGARVIDFARLTSDENLDRLEREGGVCLVYAHMGAGSYAKGDVVDPRFEERVKAISARNGWFVPASQILDFLKAQPTWTGRLSFRELIRIDVKFFLQRVGL